MGLPEDVLKLVPYEGYVDSPQGAAPEGSIWEAIGNFFADVGNAIAGGFLALANFLVGLVIAALEFGVKVLAWFSEALIQTVEAAVESIDRALSALVETILGLIVQLLESVFAPLIALLESWKGETLDAMAGFATGILPSGGGFATSMMPSPSSLDLVALVGSLFDVMLFGSSLFILFLAVGAAFEIFEVTAKAFTAGLSGLLTPVVLNLIKGFIIGIAILEIVSAFLGNVIDLLPENIGETTPFVFSLVDVFLAFVTVLGAKLTLFAEFIPPLGHAVLGFALAAMAFALLGIAAGSASIAVELGFTEDGIVAHTFPVIIDVISVALAQEAQRRLRFSQEGKVLYPLFFTVSEATATIAIVASVSGTIVDSVELGTAIAEGEF